MKEQSHSAILPPLPIVGTLRLTTRDGKSLSDIEVVEGQDDQELTPFFRACYEELELFLTGKKKDIDIKVDLSSLSEFHRTVLRFMRKIPYGKVATYGDLAKKMDSRAFQAIGSACGRNPFMLIYPCHRVVGTGNLGGFAHGLKMKKELLELESR